MEAEHALTLHRELRASPTPWVSSDSRRLCFVPLRSGARRTVPAAAFVHVSRAERELIIMRYKPYTKKRRSGVFTPLIALLAMGCPFASLALGQESSAGSGGTSVIILQPAISFERMQDGSELPMSQSDKDAYATRLDARATAAAATRELSIFDPAKASNSLGAVPADVLEQLRSQSSKLARGVVTDAAKENLTYLAPYCNDCLVLVQYMKGKVGPRGSWNPMTGGITSKLNSLLLQASLIESKTSQLVWQNEAFLRELPRPTDNKLLKTLGLLFATFTAK